ncbi:MAG: aspartyl protease family protein [Bacteroidota bacterium]
MMKQSLFIFISIIMGVSAVLGQKISTQTPELPFGITPPERSRSIYWEGWKKVEIPFQFINGLMIVEVELNEAIPLRFIFDTGAEHTILSKIDIASLLGMRYARKFTIMGADMKTELTAFLVRDVNVKVGRLFSPREAILVLDEDYFRFEELVGMEVHGILGASFFRQFVINIDYKDKIITFIKPRHFNIKKRKYQDLDIEVYRNKPYLYADMNMAGDSTRQVKLLLDTGASLPLLIYTDTDTTLTIPPNSIPGNVGRGLGGYLSGYQGRIQSLEFSDFQLGNVVTSFQKSDSIHQFIALNDRNGILGNQILKRFELVIDYWDEKVYLRPNKSYNDKFKFDRSGLVILASGQDLDKFTVQKVIENSPAARAGVQKGDVIVSLNSLPVKTFTMENISTVLQKRVGKKIRLVVKRDGKRKRFVFFLEDLI